MRRTAAPPCEELRDGRLELRADGAVDEEVAGSVDDQQAVVERREAEEPNGRSEFCETTMSQHF